MSVLMIPALKMKFHGYGWWFGAYSRLRYNYRRDITKSGLSHEAYGPRDLPVDYFPLHQLGYGTYGVLGPIDGFRLQI